MKKQKQDERVKQIEKLAQKYGSSASLNISAYYSYGFIHANWLNASFGNMILKEEMENNNGKR